MSHKRVVGLVVAFAAGLVIAACAGKTAKVIDGPREHRPPPAGPYDRQKQDIVDYMKQIDLARKDLGLAREPHQDTLLQYKHMPVAKLRLCEDDPRPNGEKCKDTCNIKEAICDNAENICRIADDLEGDDWARGKCDSAKASCKEATKKCCECASAELDGHSAGDNVCGA